MSRVQLDEEGIFHAIGRAFGRESMCVAHFASVFSFSTGPQAIVTADWDGGHDEKPQHRRLQIGNCLRYKSDFRLEASCGNGLLRAAQKPSRRTGCKIDGNLSGALPANRLSYRNPNPSS
jgi:hypothetical protein